ncbi:MAG: hypothetical protein KGJ62_13105 [Armatimonadetes bacterium]|nr:hypothetical protein [Armatimonadota bacterium]MDE2206136.1 hypothetical protein [Armatimonadota bacterium]
MIAQEKICPRCGARAPLDAGACAQCGHAYRTAFPAAPPPWAEPAAGGKTPGGAGALVKAVLWGVRIGTAIAVGLAVWLFLRGRLAGASGGLPAPAISPSAAGDGMSPQTTAGTDPITAQARSMLKQQGDNTEPSGATGSITGPDGRVHLRGGGTISKERYDEARRRLKQSPLLNSPFDSGY